MVGLEIALSRQWFVIELADTAARDDQVSLLVRQQPATRLRSALTEGSELVGAECTLLLVDYSLQSPDLRGLRLLSFSSPHVAIEPQLLLLMDNIVLTGAWVLETDRAGTDQPR